jgi:hypothetical protein
MSGAFRAALLMYVLIACLPAQGADLLKLVGHWSCKGSFSNGQPIAARLLVEADAPSGALIVHYDDAPPGGYHSLEVWMADKSGPGLRASLSDRYSGMRWFESTGWAGDNLTWVRMENGLAAEQFVYELKRSGLQVQWSSAKNGAMEVGDTIACTRAAHVL